MSMWKSTFFYLTTIGFLGVALYYVLTDDSAHAASAVLAVWVSDWARTKIKSRKDRPGGGRAR